MSENQLLTIPAVQAPEDEGENQLVERFMEASRDLVPSVQVTLAKRIIRPGSNKVVCLAAKTSIPLRDDELASVSDLALRLSDGTNVALSLSFFNDGGTEYSPLKRYVYSPADYKKKNGSNLGFVLVGMAMLFVAGSFALINKQYSNVLPSVARNAGLAQIASIAGIGLNKEAAKPAATSAIGAATKLAPTAATSSIVSTAVPGAKREGSKAANSKVSNGVSKSKFGSGHSHTVKTSAPTGTYHEAHGQTLVPPPPPTTPYMMPYGAQMPFFDPGAGVNQALTPKAETPMAPMSTRTAKASDAGKTAAAKPATTKNIEQKISDTQKAPDLKVVPDVDTSETRAQAQPQDVSIIEPKTYRRREAAYWPAVSTAPTPGSDSSSVQLERIVPRATPVTPPTLSTPTQSSENF